MPIAALALLIPITALLIPIVAILVSHQQRMAQIVHQPRPDDGQVAALRQEIAELKALVHHQAITLDNLASNQPSLQTPPPTPTITERLSAGN